MDLVRCVIRVERSLPILLGLAACTTPQAAPSPAAPTPPPARTSYLDASASFLPNLGFGLGVGRVVRSTPAALGSVEAQLVYQFLDDEIFADDGNPKAGPWYQVRAGFKRTSNPPGPRHLTTRIGAVWLRAEGEPNVIQDEGNYAGLYAGLGFETDLGPSLSVGPELTILGITRTDGFSVARPVPQINWHVTVPLGGGPRRTTLERLPLGEIYLGASGIFSPGLGGGFEVGQVFHRGGLATWSFEVLAEFEPTGDRFYFNGDGKWAQVRIGAKTSFQPSGRGHWTARGGAVWLRSTAPNDLLDQLADHIGAYGSLGYEYGLGRFTTGPELNLMLVSFEQETVFHVVPQLVWHATVGL